MLRKLPLATAIAVALMPFQSQALGLGSISTKSMLNEEFDAEIKLLSVPMGELDGVKVELASSEAFEKAGIDRSYILSRLRFTTERKDNGEAVIKVYSNELIQEPFLNFLLEVNWPKGRMVREYTVLLDPPLTTRKKSKPVSTASSSSSNVGQSTYTPKSSYPATQVQTKSSSMSSSADASEYGPVKRNETLWTIAERYSGEDASVYQMMLALLEENPQAFSDNNINTLKAGSVLRIPSLEQVTAISKEDARRISDQHYVDWKNSLTTVKAVSAPEPAVEPENVDKPKAEVAIKADEASESTAEDAVLKLSGSEAAGLEGDAGAVAKDQELTEELISAQEKVVSSQGEVQDLMSRMSLMEQQLTDMQRLLELKDEQLARLQSSNESLVSEAEQSRAALEQAQQEMTSAPVSQPAPQPVVVEKKPKPQSEMDKVNGVIDLIMSSATLMGIVVAIFVVLIALLWAAFSRRKSSEDESPVISPVADQKAPVAATAAASTAAAAAVASTPAFATQAPEEKPQQEEELSFLKEFTAGDMDSFVDLETGESDPIAEADVYIAYGRYDQAETMVSQALEAEPGNRGLQSKLLEIFYANKDTGKFNALANEMHAAGAESDDPENWNRIKLMGVDMDPENPLYQDAMDAASLDVSDSLDLADDLDDALTELESQMSADPDLADLPDADAGLNELDLTDDVAESVAEEVEDLSLEIEAPEDDVISMDELDLPEEDEIQQLGDDDNEASLSELAAELEAFDLDALNTDSLDISDTDVPATDINFDDDLLMGDDMLDELSTSLDDVDDVATKLDLAKAYMEMGDNEGARGILEEVVEEGNDGQKHEAQKLINGMG